MLFWEKLYKKIGEEEMGRRHILDMKIRQGTQMPEITTKIIFLPFQLCQNKSGLTVASFYII